MPLEKLQVTLWDLTSGGSVEGKVRDAWEPAVAPALQPSSPPTKVRLLPAEDQVRGRKGAAAHTCGRDREGRLSPLSLQKSC